MAQHRRRLAPRPAPARGAACLQANIHVPRRGRRADLRPIRMSFSRDVNVKMTHFRVGVRCMIHVRVCYHFNNLRFKSRCLACLKHAISCLASSEHFKCR